MSTRFYAVLRPDPGTRRKWDVRFYRYTASGDVPRMPTRPDTDGWLVGARYGVRRKKADRVAQRGIDRLESEAAKVISGNRQFAD